MQIITNNPDQLTINEQKSILNCKHFLVDSRKKSIQLFYVGGSLIWKPTKIDEAINYVIKNQIKEIRV